MSDRKNKYARIWSFLYSAINLERQVSEFDSTTKKVSKQAIYIYIYIYIWPVSRLYVYIHINYCKILLRYLRLSARKIARISVHMIYLALLSMNCQSNADVVLRMYRQ